MGGTRGGSCALALSLSPKGADWARFLPACSSVHSWAVPAPWAGWHSQKWTALLVSHQPLATTNVFFWLTTARCL